MGPGEVFIKEDLMEDGHLEEIRLIRRWSQTRKSTISSVEARRSWGLNKARKSGPSPRDCSGSWFILRDIPQGSSEIYPRGLHGEPQQAR